MADPCPHIVTVAVGPTVHLAGAIAIDDKTVRRPSAKKDDEVSIPMVSAVAARQRLVLGQVAVETAHWIRTARWTQAA